jgi:hypothetical protein
MGQSLKVSKIPVSAYTNINASSEGNGTETAI